MTEDEFDALLAQAEDVVHFGAWLRVVGSPVARWSEGMYRLLGLHPSTPPSHDLFLEAIHPEDRQPDVVIVARRRDATNDTRQVRLWRVGEGYRSVTTHVRYIANPDGERRQQLGLVLNAEDAVAQSGSLTRHLLQRFGHSSGSAQASTPPPRPAVQPAQRLPYREPLTPDLVRAARGIMNWSANDLAAASGLSFSTIRRIENVQDRKVTDKMVMTVRQTFEQHGVQFVRAGEAVGLVRDDSAQVSHEGRLDD